MRDVSVLDQNIALNKLYYIINRVKKVILASNSPRRRELMKLLGIPFTVRKSNFDEDLIQISNPKRYVERLSYEKAHVVAKKYKNAIIVGADTTVVLGNRIIGKSKDEKDARNTLKLLSGTKHAVITGFTMIDSTNNKSITKSVKSYIRMRKLSNAEIDSYIRSGEYKDHAGSYGIEGLGGLFVEGIIGDYYNIVGLPMKDVRDMLHKFGVKTLK